MTALDEVEAYRCDDAEILLVMLGSFATKARAAVEPLLPRSPIAHDSLGRYVRSRLGDEVHERLVDALIGSIYATDTDEFSLREVPQLAALARPAQDPQAPYHLDLTAPTPFRVVAEDRGGGEPEVPRVDLEPVRQVAIDEDWSGLRFRHVDKIARITRRESFALTRKGKERSRKN